MRQGEGLLGSIVPVNSGASLNCINVRQGLYPRPLILHFHGGGWSGGTYRAVPPTWAQVNAPVVSVEYALASDQVHGPHILNVLAETLACIFRDEALRNLLCNLYGPIDFTRVAFVGESVGGWYATVAYDAVRTLREADETFASYAAIVAYSAPTHLMRMGPSWFNVAPQVDWSLPTSGLSKFTAGMTEQSVLVHSPGATTFIDVSTFAAHSHDDALVPVSHLTWLTEHVGATMEAHFVSGAAHGWNLGQRIDEARNAFLKRELGVSLG